jgi:ribosomal protein S18 acetylase RimI-like enzyme
VARGGQKTGDPGDRGGRRGGRLCQFSILSGNGAPGPPGPRRQLGGAAEIQELYLAPEYQGIGLGGRLFAAALKRIGGRGYSRVLVRALADNDRAIGFYRRRGGKVVARTEESLGGRTLPCAWFEFRA